MCHKIGTRAPIKVYLAERFDFPVISHITISTNQMNIDIINFMVDTGSRIYIRDASKDTYIMNSYPVYSKRGTIVVVKCILNILTDARGHCLYYEPVKTFYQHHISADVKWADMLLTYELSFKI